MMPLLTTSVVFQVRPLPMASVEPKFVMIVLAVAGVLKL